MSRFQFLFKSMIRLDPLQTLCRLQKSEAVLTSFAAPVGHCAELLNKNTFSTLPGGGDIWCPDGWYIISEELLGSSLMVGVCVCVCVFYKV